MRWLRGVGVVMLLALLAPLPLLSLAVFPRCLSTRAESRSAMAWSASVLGCWGAGVLVDDRGAHVVVANPHHQVLGGRAGLCRPRVTGVPQVMEVDTALPSLKVSERRSHDRRLFRLTSRPSLCRRSFLSQPLTSCFPRHRRKAEIKRGAIPAHGQPRAGWTHLHPAGPKTDPACQYHA